MTDNDKLIKACEEGSVEEVERLVREGADPDCIGAIHQASAAGKTDILSVLLNHNADTIHLLDYGRQTALHYAARHGRQDVVKLLVEKGAEVEAQNDNGQTALHCAA